MKSLFDFNDPFYKPLWLRVLIVGTSTAWGLFEFSAGETFWGTLFCVVGAYSFYGLFIAFDPRDPETGEKQADRDDS